MKQRNPGGCWGTQRTLAALTSHLAACSSSPHLRRNTRQIKAWSFSWSQRISSFTWSQWVHCCFKRRMLSSSFRCVWNRGDLLLSFSLSAPQPFLSPGKTESGGSHFTKEENEAQQAQVICPWNGITVLHYSPGAQPHVSRGLASGCSTIKIQGH